MRTGLQTWGTHGDIRPFLALSAELARRGHEVTLSVTEIRNGDYSAYGERYGFRVIHPGRIHDPDSSFRALGREFVRSSNPALKARAFVETFLDPCLEEMYRAAEKLCTECDVVVGHLFAYSLKAAAQLSGTPWVTLHTTPLLCSNEVAPPGWPAMLPGLGWKFFDLVLGQLWKPGINRFLRGWGAREIRSVMNQVFLSEELNLLAVSPLLYPQGSRDDIRSCGHMTFPNEAECSLSPEIEGFLSEGDPPVFITFGSMIHGEWENSDLTGMVKEALNEKGLRGIMQSGGKGREDNLLLTGECPHHMVFPRCRAVVHHGGCGTSHTACRAGKPSVVVPYTSDQPMWGRLLESAGVAPAMIHRRRLSASRLAAALGTVTGNPVYVERAQTLGDSMKKENGCAMAADALEERYSL